MRPLPTVTIRLVFTIKVVNIYIEASKGLSNPVIR